MNGMKTKAYKKRDISTNHDVGITMLMLMIKYFHKKVNNEVLANVRHMCVRA